MRIELWTDGACTGNPGGTGGWAYVLLAYAGGKEIRRKLSSGSESGTTNNRMELRAVIEGLRALARPTSVEVFADSAYVVEAFLQGWILNWEDKGWRRGKVGMGQPIPNSDLWQELLALSRMHNVSWNRVKGHAGVSMNEYCDSLATTAIRVSDPEPFEPRLQVSLRLAI